jgi:hypothetical protein
LHCWPIGSTPRPGAIGGTSAYRLREFTGCSASPAEPRSDAVIRGALIPPVGRFLSKYCHALYFPVAALLPPLVGQVVTVLQKRSD